MFIQRLHCKRGVIVNPKWPDIEAAIRELDGDDIHLSGPRLSSMTIGGSPYGYFTQITLDGDYFHYLLGPSRTDELVPVVIGRQEIKLERRKVSDLQSVLAAAKVFAKKGKVHDELEWELG